MGPTNAALVLYFRADQLLREAQDRLSAANRDVRIQERKLFDLQERHRLAAQQLKEKQSAAGQLELDLRSRDEHIEHLREQQQSARNNREYQAFLVEINTAKVDRAKIEDDTIKVLEDVERLSTEAKALAAEVDTERQRLEEMRKQIGARLAELQADIDALQPQRDAAGAGVPGKAREAFDRLAERYDGEAMAAMSKPDRRNEEYVCTVCNMDLAVDVYNKLHSRDEIVFCPSCRRILYIPDDLPPEVAIKTKVKPKVAKESAKEKETASVAAAPADAASESSAPEES
jgi:uncharacterized protein